MFWPLHAFAQTSDSDFTPFLASFHELHELVEVRWQPTWELEELMNSWPCMAEKVQEYAAQTETPTDLGIDNLIRQGFPTHIVYMI